MATNNVPVFKLKTDEATKSVKELKDELKSLKDVLVSTEKGTAEYSQALQRAADIQHELKEQMEEINASAMDFGQIMGNVVNATGGIVSGFQAAKATMNLFGVENEEVMKSLQKMQNLMAITQALPGIEKGIKSLKRFVLLIDNATTSTKSFSNAQKAQAATETASTTATKGLQTAMVGETAATKSATVATHSFKKALISTGIGAIVVLVGTLIAHLEDLAKWLGFGGDKAEEQEKKLEALNEAYELFNKQIEAGDVSIKAYEKDRQKELQTMDDRIEKMKAEGKTEAQIIAQQEEDLETRKRIANSTITLVEAQKTELAAKYEEISHALGIYELDTINAENATYRLSMAMSQLAEAEEYLNSVEDISDAQKRKTEIEIANYKELINISNKYIAEQEKRESVEKDIHKRETDINNEKIKNAKKLAEERKKLKEEYDKFNNSLVLSTKEGKDKEIAQIDQGEKEKEKKLKEYRKKRIITEEEYENQLTLIHTQAQAEREKVDYKYEEQALKKRNEFEKQKLDIAKRQRENAAIEAEMGLKNEESSLITSLANRKISIVDYYKQQEVLILRDLENKKKFATEEYEANKGNVERQIEENKKLLNSKGITDEQKEQILSQQADLNQQLLDMQADYNSQMQDLDIAAAQARQESRFAIIEAEMEALTMLRDGVTSAMDAIIASGDGLSSNWVTAFDTLSTGLLDLGQKVKEGKTEWQDYAKMAVAGLQAAASMMSALADEQDANTKEGFEKQKKFQIAAATMNMLGGVISAWTSAMNPANAWMTIWGQIAMGAASTAMILTTGMMQINKIKQQKFGGGDSGASNPSAGAAASVIAPVQYTQDVQGASIEDSVQDTKVYVTETDITNTQNRVSVTENEAKY